MLAHDLAGKVLAQLLLRDALLAEHRLELAFAEIAGGVGKGGRAGDLGIDQFLADPDAVLLAIGDECLDRDHLVDDLAQAALGEKLRHGELRPVLPEALVDALGAALHFGGGDLLAGDRGDIGGARAEHAQPARAGDVAGGKGEAEDQQQAQREIAPDL